MNDEEIKSAISRLILDYGRYAGFQDLAFDEHGLLAFQFDDVEITILFDGRSSDLVLQSVLDMSKVTVDRSFIISVHAANCEAIRAGIGSVVIDQDLGGWIWIDRIATAGLSSERLHEMLNRAAKAIRFWRTHLGGIGKGPDGQGQGQATLSDDLHLIRI